MKNSHLLLILIPITVFASVLGYFGYTYLTVDSVHTIPVLVSVNETLGLNLDTQQLNFGRLRPLSSGERYLEISNKGDHTMIVSLQSQGNISAWLHFSRNNIKLMPQSNESVRVILDVPDVAWGRYNGSVRVTYKKKLWREMT